MGSKRIDHIAFRVVNLNKAVKFYTKIMGFVVTDRFFINFDDGTKARCAALRARNSKGISIFISEGIGKGGIIKEWVKENGNALHHIAYAVDNIKSEVNQMKKRGIKFTTKEILESEELLQIFSLPISETGIIHEIIQRKGKKSFSVTNVKRLMGSTKQIKSSRSRAKRKRVTPAGL